MLQCPRGKFFPRCSPCSGLSCSRCYLRNTEGMVKSALRHAERPRLRCNVFKPRTPLTDATSTTILVLGNTDSKRPATCMYVFHTGYDASGSIVLTIEQLSMASSQRVGPFYTNLCCAAIRAFGRRGNPIVHALHSADPRSQRMGKGRSVHGARTPSEIETQM